MMMMNTSTTTVITSRTKLPHININNRNYTNTITSCCDLLSYNPPKKLTMVHNNNSAVFPPLLCSTNHYLFSNDKGDKFDDGFRVEFESSGNRTFALGRAMNQGRFHPKDLVIPDYPPIKVLTYGVGSKFKLALGIESGMDMTEIICNDLVAMNFNNIVSIGAQPTLFLTPHACPRKLREAMRQGVLCASRCDFSISFSDIEMESRQIVSSIGYGSIEGPEIFGTKVAIGDVLIGLPSNGVHSHGFSLVKRVIEQSGSSLKDNLPGTNITLGESLMTPTPIYVKQVLDIISRSKGGLRGITYITSGGLIKNLYKILRLDKGAVIFSNSWPVPPIFEWIQEVGSIADDEMRRTLNMGIGMVLAIDKKIASRIIKESCRRKYAVYRIGEVVSGDGVTYR